MAKCWQITQQKCCKKNVVWNVLRTPSVNVAFIHSISSFVFKPTGSFSVQFATTSAFNKYLNGIHLRHIRCVTIWVNCHCCEDL